MLLPRNGTFQVLPLAEAVQLQRLLIGHVQQLVQSRAEVGKFVSGSFFVLHFSHGLLLGEGSIPSFVFL